MWRGIWRLFQEMVTGAVYISVWGLSCLNTFCLPSRHESKGSKVEEKAKIQRNSSPRPRKKMGEVSSSLRDPMRTLLLGLKYCYIFLWNWGHQKLFQDMFVSFFLVHASSRSKCFWLKLFEMKTFFGFHWQLSSKVVTRPIFQSWGFIETFVFKI